MFYVKNLIIMKHKFYRNGFQVIILLMLPTIALCQPKNKIDSSKTAVYLAPGANAALTKTTVRPYTASISSNIQVFPSSNPQSEIHISINKTNPQILLLSSNTFPVTNSWQGAYWSTNGGITWAGSDGLPNNAPGRGDPSTAFDASGHGYIATMTPVPNDINAAPTGYSIQRTVNNIGNWSGQVQATGNFSFDKEMICADDVPTSPFVNYLYCAWMGGNNIVQFNRSIDQGVNFSNPTNLNNHWGQGANVQTGLNGEVYVCWADYTSGGLPEQGLGFTSSVDGGQTFAAARVVFPYTGIRNNFGGQSEFNNIRVNSFPSMAVDKSNGPHRGRAYVAYAARENGNTSGRAIVQLRWSDNQGIDWSAPTTVSIANGTQSWFPWMAVDDHGVVFIVYYSLDQSSGFSTNTYVAISLDGGNTVSNQQVSTAPHTTAPIPVFGGGYMGDYIGITAFGWKGYAAWMDNRTGQWQNYVDVVDNTPVITGQAAFCNSSTFTASNVPSGAAVWSVSPNGIVNLFPNGNQVTATKIIQGQATLTLSVYGSPVGNVNISTVPVTSVSSNMSGPCSNGIQTWFVNATPNMLNVSNWNWTVDNPTSGIHIFSPNSPGTYMDVSSGGGVSVTYTDECGETSLQNGVTIYSPCGTRFAVFSNPASSTVNITSLPANGKTANARATISEINIFDFQNNLKKHQSFDKLRSISIDVSTLPVGLYVIEIVDGTYKERQKLQIAR